MGCDAKNLIYLMQCSGCDEEYIGEAGDSIRHRMTVHRQQIRNSNFRIQHVSNHIATCASVVNAVTGKFWRIPGSSNDSEMCSPLYLQGLHELLFPPIMMSWSPLWSMVGSTYLQSSRIVELAPALRIKGKSTQPFVTMALRVGLVCLG